MAVPPAYWWSREFPGDEIELSALSGQCLGRRIPDLASMRREVSAWQLHRNHRGAPIHWHFTTADARIKLTRLYPKL